MEGFEGSQDWFQGAPVESAINVIGEALEVYTRPVNDSAQAVQSPWRDVGVTHPDILYSFLFGEDGNIDHVLKESCGLRIRVGNGLATVSGRSGDDILRGEIVISRLVGTGLRYFPVLTIQAMEVTTGHRYRKNGGAGIEVEKRLLLHGVHVHAAGISVRNRIQLSRDVYSGAADAPISGGYLAFVGTGATHNVPIVKAAVEIGLLHMTI
jgi:hypothetical protein